MKKIITIVCILLCSFTVQAMEKQRPRRPDLRKSKAAKGSKKKKPRLGSRESIQCSGCAELNKKVYELSQDFAKLSLFMQRAQSVNEEQWKCLGPKVEMLAKQLVATEKRNRINSLQSGMTMKYLCMREEALVKVSEDFYAQMYKNVSEGEEDGSDAEGSITQYSVSSEGIESTQAHIAELAEPKEQVIASSSSPRKCKKHLGSAKRKFKGKDKKKEKDKDD